MITKAPEPKAILQDIYDGIVYNISRVKKLETNAEVEARVIKYLKEAARQLKEIL